jgi:mRNA-degrading endonuclease RelE of RelBE toxin-antitoxin system
MESNHTALPCDRGNANVEREPITIVEMREFIRSAAVVLTSDQIDEIKTFLAFNPMGGDLIPGTGGARKLRWAAKGKGKRGGARVIYYFLNPNRPLFLLSAYAKSVKVDLTERQKQELRSIVSQL